MLFDTTVRKELARGFGATLVVILTIVLTSFLIRTVGQAASGSIAPQDVVLLLGYVTLGHLPTILACSLFVAVVLTVGRMYRDSEMAIWFASGVGLKRFVRPVLRMAWPVLLVVGLLLLFVWPWGNRSRTELQERYQQRGDLSRVTPGVFQSSRDGRRVFFVERGPSATNATAVAGAASNADPNLAVTTLSEASSARNVFILAQNDRGESVTSAKSGRLETEAESGDIFLVLERGQRSDLNLASGESSVSRFEDYRVLASERQTRSAQAQPPKAVRTIDLIRQPTPRHQGELVWRLGMLLAAGNLLLLGLAMSAAQPRRASNWNLLLALLAFLVYFNLVGLSQAWVASGRLGMATALILLHGGAFTLALALLWWRDHAAVLRLWPRRHAKTAAASAPAVAASAGTAA
jgi:lipopolysaccharide export system permease protein